MVDAPKTGSQADIANRILSLIPSGWFSSALARADGDPQPGVIGALVQGPAAVFSWIHGLISYVSLQTRRSTTSDSFIDLGIFDFFGMRIRRRASQTDASARAMWKQEVLRRRNTRAYVQQAVEDLTGTEVSIFE